MVHALLQADLVKQAPSLRYSAAFQVELIREQHVFESGERLDQLVGLKNETDFAPAHRRQFGLREVVDRNSVEPDLSFAG